MLHTSSRIAAALLPILFLSVAVRAADPPTKEQVADWVKGLASDSFEERENASKALWEAGKAAEPALRQVVKGGDAEVIRRARAILDKFDWGLYPDTPAAVAGLIDEYRSGTPENQPAVVGKLLDQGGAGYAALMKLAGREKDAPAKKLIWDLLTADTPRLAGALLAEGHEARLAGILEQALSGEGEQPHANYAAYLMVGGQLDDRLRALQKKAGAAPDKKSALMLAYLCRAKGDLAGARKYAQAAERAPLLQTVLVEQEDWKELLKLLDKPPLTDERPSSAGLRLACLRLMGERDGFAAELAKLRDDPAGGASVAAFLLNGRPDDALTWLTKNNNYQAAADLLAARLRFREALAIADKAAPEAKGADPTAARLFKAGLLARLGERKQARELFDKLAAAINPDESPGLLEPIVVAEAAAGFKDEAFARAAGLLAKAGGGDCMGLLNLLFPPDDIETGVEPWWTFLRRRFPKDDTAANLKRLRDLLGRKMSRKETATLLKEMADAADTLKPELGEPWLHCAAETCRALGRDDLVEGYLERWAAAGGDARAWLRLGDVAMDNKRPKEAAERYKRAWEKDRGDPLPLYLHGRALVQAGQEKEGRRWMEAAELLPLGSDEKRAGLAAGLAERGLDEAAGKEWERLGRLTLMPSEYSTLTARALAEKAVTAKDYVKAATWSRRDALQYFNYDDAEGLLWLLAAERRHRARALAVAGRLDDMRKEVNAVLAVEPNIELAIDLVPELTRRGHNKEADDLFARVYAPHDAVCKEYPNSAWEHNNAAWLAVRCKRDLDAALEHARKAVDLEPDSSAHLDTLAEVHFQRGDKDKAVELMTKCVALEPKTRYFRNQLKRMQAGDRDAELPRESSTATGYRGIGVRP